MLDKKRWYSFLVTLLLAVPEIDSTAQRGFEVHDLSTKVLKIAPALDRSSVYDPVRSTREAEDAHSEVFQSPEGLITLGYNNVSSEPYGIRLSDQQFTYKSNPKGLFLQLNPQSVRMVTALSPENRPVIQFKRQPKVSDNELLLELYLRGRRTPGSFSPRLKVFFGHDIHALQSKTDFSFFPDDFRVFINSLLGIGRHHPSDNSPTREIDLPPTLSLAQRALFDLLQSDFVSPTSRLMNSHSKIEDGRLTVETVVDFSAKRAAQSKLVRSGGSELAKIKLQANGRRDIRGSIFPFFYFLTGGIRP